MYCITSLPNVYPYCKKVKPETYNCYKVNNTHWLSPPFPLNSLTGFYVIRSHSPSVEGLTAYRYGNTHTMIITVMMKRKYNLEI